MDLEHARQISDGVFAQIDPAAWFDRPIAERHRLIFYLGHLEAFDWNQIGRVAAGRGPIDPGLDRLFARGIDPPPGELPSDRPEDWPSLAQVRTYVLSVRRRLNDVLARMPDEAIAMAVEHRLMHVETLTYLLHALPYDRRIVAPPRAPGESATVEARPVEIPAGPARLGRTRDEGFGWDNEFEAHDVQVNAFQVGKYKITNGQYLKFVEDGGEVPPQWQRHGSGWMRRGFDGEAPLPLSHPVYVTWHQARAYAAWAGGSLPTEAQFHRYALGGYSRGNFDFAERDTIPVTATPAADSTFGVAQAVGNGWEWTSTVFAPFPGFVPSLSYPGYSADFFDGEHYVLKGASCATARSLVRPSFRNWFRPHYSHAYTAFRVVES